MSTRREFLATCSTMVAGLGLSSVGMARAGAKPIRSLDEISYAALAAQVNTRFRVRLLVGGLVELTLLKSRLAPTTPAFVGRRPPADAGNEKFSLIFSGSRDAILASAIHRFEHRTLGEFDMYIGQIGSPHENEVRYEAGFNRRIPAAATPALS